MVHTKSGTRECDHVANRGCRDDDRLDGGPVPLLRRNRLAAWIRLCIVGARRSTLLPGGRAGPPPLLLRLLPLTLARLLRLRATLLPLRFRIRPLLTTLLRLLALLPLRFRVRPLLTTLIQLLALVRLLALLAGIRPLRVATRLCIGAAILLLLDIPLVRLSTLLVSIRPLLVARLRARPAILLLLLPLLIHLPALLVGVRPLLVGARLRARSAILLLLDAPLIRLLALLAGVRPLRVTARLCVGAAILLLLEIALVRLPALLVGIRSLLVGIRSLLVAARLCARPAILLLLDRPRVDPFAGAADRRQAAAGRYPAACPAGDPAGALTGLVRPARCSGARLVATRGTARSLHAARPFATFLIEAFQALAPLFDPLAALALEHIGARVRFAPKLPNPVAALAFQLIHLAPVAVAIRPTAFAQFAPAIVIER